MVVGPPKSAVGSWLQTTSSCCDKESWWCALRSKHERSVEMGLKQQGLGLQLASIASQVDLNKSQAEKNKADTRT